MDKLKKDLELLRKHIANKDYLFAAMMKEKIEAEHKVRLELKTD
jgi:hypothetical protein